MQVETVELETQPLLEQTSRTIRDWTEWKELWEHAECFELQWSLLNCIFSIPIDSSERQQKVIFLLRLAEGRTPTSHLSPTDAQVELCYRPGQLWSNREQMRREIEMHRKKLAIKAFQELGDHFFTNSSPTGKPSWYDIAIEPTACAQLIHFFRIDRYGQIGGVTNYQPNEKQAAQRAGEFLLNFCDLGWRSQQRAWDTDFVSDTPALPRLQPQFVKVLLAMGKVQWLLDDARYPLSPASIKELERIALSARRLPSLTQPGQSVTRKPVSLEESLAYGSAAAQLLLIRGIISAERARAEELQKALEGATEAKQRVRKARSSK